MDDKARGSLRIVAVSCLVFGFAWMAFALPFYLNQHRVVAHWPEALATVRESSVIDAPGKGLYQTHFEFTLPAAEGVRSVTLDGYRQSNNRQRIEAEAQRFAKGQSYTVRVNPSNANELRLDTDQPMRYYFLPITLAIVGAAFLLIAIVLFGVTAR